MGTRQVVVRYCDWCSKEVTDYFIITVSHKDADGVGRSRLDLRYELCALCADKAERFILEAKTNDQGSNKNQGLEKHRKKDS